jgi:nucleotide-binding universal stress UspA family protein
MKVLLAADGSSFTKKSLAWLCANQEFAAAIDELVVLNVQPLMPPRVTALAGAGTVAAWHRDEAHAVLDPIEKFLAQNKIAYRTHWVTGHYAQEIVRMAQEINAGMIVMGTHGLGLFGRALMGSVAQQVLYESPVPVLLVK